MCRALAPGAICIQITHVSTSGHRRDPRTTRRSRDFRRKIENTAVNVGGELIFLLDKRKNATLRLWRWQLGDRFVKATTRRAAHNVKTNVPLRREKR